MKMLSQGKKTEEKEKGDIMEIIHDEMHPLERSGVSTPHQDLEEPSKTERCNELSMQAFLGLGHRCTGLKQTLGNHERRDEA